MHVVPVQSAGLAWRIRMRAHEQSCKDSNAAASWTDLLFSARSMLPVVLDLKFINVIAIAGIRSKSRLLQ